MFPKKNRLSKKKDFDNVFKEGKGRYGKYLGIKIKTNKLEYTRIGIIVGIKVNKSAVKRNKIKRQIRAALEKNDIKKGFDVIVITNAAINELSFKQIKANLLKQLNHLKVIKPTKKI
ncbi:ribonuclease P protein component [bacterium]|nr:ribonuclease P protein component [bacterium]